MRTIIFQNNVAVGTTYTWVVDRDLSIRSFISSSGFGQGLITEDPAQNTSTLSAPTQMISVGQDTLLVPSSNTFQADMDIPILAGKTLLISVTASKQTLIIFVEDKPI